MDADEKARIYNEGLQAGMKHKKPSPETERRLSKLESKFEKFTDILEKIQITLTEIKKDQEAMNRKLQD